MACLFALVVAGCLGVLDERGGDGVVYILQAADGDPFARSIHVGFLAPLWLWVQVAGWLGLAPVAAAKACVALWTALSLPLLSAIAGRWADDEQALTRAPIFGALLWLAPLALLACPPFWRALTFVEVYGPLGTLSLGVVLALLHGQDRLAAALLVWSALLHPGALAMGPGLLLLGGLRAERGGRRRALRIIGLAAVPYVIALALLWPDWWSGGRGVAVLPPFQRGVARSLIDFARALPRDGGSWMAFSLIAFAPRGGRSRLLGLGLVLLGAALGLDRYRDNPGQLPTLWLLCALVPEGARWVGRRLGRGLHVPLLMLALLLVGGALRVHLEEVGATEDAAARVRERCEQALSPESSSWSQRQLRGFACGDD